MIARSTSHPGTHRRSLGLLGVVLMLLTAGLVMMPGPIGLHTNRSAVGGVGHLAAVPSTARSEPVEHVLHTDALLATTAAVGLGLVALVAGIRRRQPQQVAPPSRRNRGPPAGR